MTVHRATTNITTGETETRALEGAPVHSSDNHQPSGITVIRGFGGENVSSPEALQDDDLVNIDGVEMSVRAAKQYGVLDQAFKPTLSPDQLDPKLSAAAANTAAAENKATASSDKAPEGYEATSASINAAVEAGELSSKEGNEYDTAFGALEMAGIGLEAAIETLDGIQDGTIGELDVDASDLRTVRHAEEQVRTAATEAALAEMDPETFAWLETAAAATPAVDAAIKRYALDRAQGNAEGITWADLAEHLRDQMSNL